MEFHVFLKAHPFESWHNRDPTPLKTMKTMMHMIVSRLGAKQVFTVFREKEAGMKGSEAWAYLLKLIERELQKPVEGVAALP